MFLGTELGIWLRIFLWVAVSAVIWLVWYGWWITRNSGIVLCLVGAQLFSFVQIVLSLLALGLFGVLYSEILIPVNLAVSAVIFFALVRPGIGKILPFHKAVWSNLRARRPSIGVVFLATLLAGITGWNLFWGWFLPPREWDSLNYHLPIATAFYQAHAIGIIDSPISYVRGFPFNGELLQVWALAAVGVDKVADLTTIPFILIGVLAVYGLSRSLGAKPEASALGAAIMAFTPRILMQQSEPMVDALFASTIAMGMFMILGISAAPDEDRERRMRLSAIGTAASAGLITGMKVNGIVFALGLCVLFWVRWVYSMRKSDSPAAPFGRRRIWARVLIPSLLLFLGLCLYPYLRDWVYYGNPVYPHTIQLGGTILFPGIRDLSEVEGDNTVEAIKQFGIVGRTIYPWFEPYETIRDIYLGGLGPLWIVIGVPALLFWSLRILRRRRVVEFVVVAMLLVGVFATPAFWNPRYAIPLMILGSIAAGLALEELGSWPRRLIVAEIAFLSLFSVFNTLAPRSVSPQDAYDVLLKQDDLTRSGPQFVNPNFGRAAYEWIDQSSMGRSLIVSYGEYVYFPTLLCGSDLRNRVMNIFPNSNEEWIASLTKAEVDLVLVRTDMPTYVWIKNSMNFQEVFRDGIYVVFERIP